MNRVALYIMIFNISVYAIYLIYEYFRISRIMEGEDCEEKREIEQLKSSSKFFKDGKEVSEFRDTLRSSHLLGKLARIGIGDPLEIQKQRKDDPPREIRFLDSVNLRESTGRNIPQYILLKQIDEILQSGNVEDLSAIQKDLNNQNALPKTSSPSSADKS